jgi:ABC-type nitrate/sulfonate/bicarbonate transport system permease component
MAGVLRLLNRHLPMIVRACSLAAFFIAWEIYARGQPRLIMAPFSDVVVALVDLVQQSEFRSAYWETLKPFGIGLILAITIGVPFGLLMGLYGPARALFMPHVSFVNAVPMTAFIPLIVIGFGIGLSARVAVVFFFALPDIVISSAAGVRYVNQNLVDMGRSFQASKLGILFRIVLPGSFPGIMAGCRLGAGRAVIGMVAAELLLVSVGLGALISRYRGYYQTDNLYAAVLVLAITGIVVLEIVRRVEHAVLHWHRAGQEPR